MITVTPEHPSRQVTGLDSLKGKWQPHNELRGRIEKWSKLQRWMYNRTVPDLESKLKTFSENWVAKFIDQVQKEGTVTGLVLAFNLQYGEWQLSEGLVKDWQLLPSISGISDRFGYLKGVVADLRATMQRTMELCNYLASLGVAYEEMVARLKKLSSEQIPPIDQYDEHTRYQINLVRQEYQLFSKNDPSHPLSLDGLERVQIDVAGPRGRLARLMETSQELDRINTIEVLLGEVYALVVALQTDVFEKVSENVTDVLANQKAFQIAANSRQRLLIHSILSSESTLGLTTIYSTAEQVQIVSGEATNSIKKIQTAIKSFEEEDYKADLRQRLANEVPGIVQAYCRAFYFAMKHLVLQHIS